MRLLNSSLVVALLFYSSQSLSQKIDTLVDVGGYKLHFTILKGKGTPMLFEAGAGNDGTIWESVLQPIAKITGTTLITYDREGFGKSEINKNESSDEKHGIKSGIEALETALKKLGYEKDIIFVTHSYGGLYATLYSARHPDLVKSVVFIDANHAHCVSDEAIKKTVNEAELAQLKQEDPGQYYLSVNFPNTIALMRQIVLPAKIPTIDIVSDLPFIDDSTHQATWKSCHQQFSGIHPNNQSIVASGCGHYVFLENPPLAINAIVKGFCLSLSQAKRMDVLNRNLDYSIDIANEAKKQEYSEANFNLWGYSLLRQNQLQKALEVLRLNVSLYPLSWNVYDSYGEALLKNGQKEEAIKMYQKSIELNPKNDNGKKVLERISN